MHIITLHSSSHCTQSMNWQISHLWQAQYNRTQFYLHSN